MFFPWVFYWELNSSLCSWIENWLSFLLLKYIPHTLIFVPLKLQLIYLFLKVSLSVNDNLHHFHHFVLIDGLLWTSMQGLIILNILCYPSFSLKTRIPVVFPFFLDALCFRYVVVNFVLVVSVVVRMTIFHSFCLYSVFIGMGRRQHIVRFFLDIWFRRIQLLQVIHVDGTSSKWSFEFVLELGDSAFNVCLMPVNSVT